MTPIRHASPSKPELKANLKESPMQKAQRVRNVTSNFEMYNNGAIDMFDNKRCLETDIFSNVTSQPASPKKK